MEKKTIVLGVTGGIAAYKTANLASRFTKEGHDVHVIMTKNAMEFITPLTFETLTGNKCITDTFDRNFEWDVKHVSIAKRADVLLIAPATANIAAKLAHGIADDMLTTTVLAMRCPILISPAMNTAMYENPVTQQNLDTLRQRGFHIIDAASGMLACKDVGKGRMPEPDELYEEVMRQIAYEKDLSGVRVLVTAGPTQEPLDPVRYLTNHSTGKMGYAVARAAGMRGAQVTLVSGPVSLAPPSGAEVVPVVTAAEMFEETTRRAGNADFIVKTAAVADFTPERTASEKIKKGAAETMQIPLQKTQDILAYLGAHKKDGQVLCGFSMETEHLLENSKAKLERKHADMIVANSLKEEGAGFAADTNIATLITADGHQVLDKMPKEALAHKILDRMSAIRSSKNA